MLDVITIGSATADIFMKSSEFHLQKSAQGVQLCQNYGEKINIDDCLVTSGGAGTNTAVGFARLGFHTACVVEIGKDHFAQLVEDDLRRDKVELKFVISEKSENTALSVLLISGDGERTALTHRGASSKLEPRDMPWSALKETRWVHLSNVAGNMELLTSLFSHLSNGLAGLSWNPGSNELKLLNRKTLRIEQIPVSIFFVNSSEWEMIDNVHKDILSHVPIVVVSHGKDGGVVYSHQNYQLQYEGKKVVTVQDTGAGDAFCTGFVAAHLFGLTQHDCIEWGKRNAASVVSHMGAKKGLLRKHEIVGKL